MSSITHQIRLVTSAAAAIVEIQKYRGAIVDCTEVVEQNAATLSGDKLLKGANEWASAVAKIDTSSKQLGQSSAWVQEQMAVFRAENGLVANGLVDVTGKSQGAAAAIEKVGLKSYGAALSADALRDSTKLLAGAGDDANVALGNLGTAAANIPGFFGVALGTLALAATGVDLLRQRLQESDSPWASFGDRVAAALPIVGRFGEAVRLVTDWLPILKEGLSGVAAELPKIRDADKIGDSMGKMWQNAKRELSDFGTSAQEGLRQFDESIKKSEQAAQAYAKELANIRNELTGKGLIDQTNKYVQAIGGLKGVADLSTEGQKKLNDAVVKAIAIYQELGREAPAALRAIEEATRPAIVATVQFTRLGLTRMQEILPIVASQSDVVADAMQAMGNRAKGLTDDGLLPATTALRKMTAEGLTPAGDAIVTMTGLMPALSNVTRDTRVALRDTGDEAKQAAESVRFLIGSLMNLGDALQDLGARSDSTFGRVTSGIGKMVSAFAQGAEQWERQQALNKNWGKSMSDNIAIGASYATSILDGVGAMDQATSAGTRGQNVLGGLREGMKLGMAVAGPWGAAIGGAAGALIGWARGASEAVKINSDLVRAFGDDIQITEELTEKIKAMGKELGVKRNIAILLNLDELIRASGGLSTTNIQNFMERSVELFDIWAKGGKAGAVALDQLTKALGQFGVFLVRTKGDMTLWVAMMERARKEGIDTATIWQTVFPEMARAIEEAGGIADKVLIDLIARAIEAGEATQEMIDFIGRALDQFGKGMSDALKSTTAPFDGLAKKIDDAAKQVGEAEAAITKLGKEGKKGTEEWAKAVANLNDKLGQQTNLLRDQMFAAGTSKQALDDFATITLSTFARGIDSGLSFSQALRSVGPSIQQLEQAYTDLGIPIEDSGLQSLIASQRMIANFPAQMAGIDGLTSSLEAMSRIPGAITAPALEAMGRRGAAAYTQLQSAAEQSGGGQMEAMRPMIPWLEDMAEAAEKYGIPLDANTQLLIAQARELGLMTDKAPSQIDVMKKGFDDVVKVLKDIVKEISALPGKLSQAGSTGRSAMRDIETGARDAESAVEDLGDAVDTVSFGESPGGFKEWPIMLDAAMVSMDRFHAHAIPLLDDLNTHIKDFAIDRGTLDGFYSAHHGTPYDTGGIGIDLDSRHGPTLHEPAGAPASTRSGSDTPTSSSGGGSVTFNITIQALDSSNMLEAAEKKLVPAIRQVLRENPAGEATYFVRDYEMAERRVHG